MVPSLPYHNGHSIVFFGDDSDSPSPLDRRAQAAFYSLEIPDMKGMHLKTLRDRFLGLSIVSLTGTALAATYYMPLISPAVILSCFGIGSACSFQLKLRDHRASLAESP